MGDFYEPGAHPALRHHLNLCGVMLRTGGLPHEYMLATQSTHQHLIQRSASLALIQISIC
jgi:hypothetical protein